MQGRTKSKRWRCRCAERKAPAAQGRRAGLAASKGCHYLVSPALPRHLVGIRHLQIQVVPEVAHVPLPQMLADFLQGHRKATAPRMSCAALTLASAPWHQPFCPGGLAHQYSGTDTWWAPKLHPGTTARSAMAADHGSHVLSRAGALASTEKPPVPIAGISSATEGSLLGSTKRQEATADCTNTEPLPSPAGRPGGSPFPKGTARQPGLSPGTELPPDAAPTATVLRQPLQSRSICWTSSADSGFLLPSSCSPGNVPTLGR